MNNEFLQQQAKAIEQCNKRQIPVRRKEKAFNKIIDLPSKEVK